MMKMHSVARLIKSALYGPECNAKGQALGKCSLASQTV